jgi:hypothetical protein
VHKAHHARLRGTQVHMHVHVHIGTLHTAHGTVARICIFPLLCGEQQQQACDM